MDQEPDTEAAQLCASCRVPLPKNHRATTCPKCLLQLAMGGFDDDSEVSEDDVDEQPTVVISATEGEVECVVQPFEMVPPSVLNQALNQYVVTDFIGRGGMGSVYLASQRRLNRSVAIKVMPAHVGKEMQFAERFEREAQSMASLQHPNIVAVYDFGEVEVEDTDLLYLVMEYVDGANLLERIRAGSLLPIDGLKVVQAVCEALQFAHERNIIHRDIKPANILIGDNGDIKVADFGLAKVLRQDTDSKVDSNGDLITMTSVMMGTPGYLAPEAMVAGSRDLDHRADIFATGVMIYELLTGEIPVGAFKPVTKQAANLSIDPAIDEIVARAMAPNVEQRYQRIDELNHDLTELMATLDSSATRLPVGSTRKIGGLKVTTSTALELKRAEDEEPPDFKPVALFVSVGDSRLSAEIDQCAAALLKAEVEYRVVTLDQPSFDELEEVMQLHGNQIVIFHYAGHTGKKGGSMLPLRDDRDHQETLENLEELLEDRKSLRLIYINAPISEQQVESLKGRCNPGVSVICRSKVKKNCRCKDEAVRFYRVFNDESIKYAFEKSRKGKTLTLTGGSVGFRLEDVYNRISLLKLLYYAAALLVIGHISAWMSYYQFTSPAFLSEFGYGITDKDIADLPQVDTGDAGELSGLEKSFQSAAIDLNDSKGLGRAINNSRHFGFLIECVRNMLAVLYIVFGLGLIYRRKLPEEPDIFTPAWLRQKSTLYGLLPGAVMIFLALVYYHSVLAPQSLANFGTAGSKWSALHPYHEVWDNAGRNKWLHGALDDEFLSAEPTSDFDSTPAIDSNSRLWKNLYLYPYLSYLPFSFASYLGVALPLLYVAILGSVSGWRQMSSLIAIAMRRIGENRYSTVGSALGAAFERVQANTREFLFVSTLLTLGALFEAAVGYLTLAKMAIVIVAATLFLILTVVGAVAAMTYSYSNAWSSANRKLNHEMRQELNRFRPVKILHDGPIIVFLVITVISGIYFANWLPKVIF